MLASDQKLKDAWGSMDDTTKSQFIGKAHEVIGKDMKKMLETTISETVCKFEKTEFEAHGEYKDKQIFEQKVQR